MSRARSIVNRSLLHVEKLDFGMPVPGDGIARIASEFCAFGNIGPVFGGLGKRFLASSAVQFYVIHVSHGISIKRDGLRLLLPVRGTPCLGMLGAFRRMLASCGSGRLSVWLLWWGSRGGRFSVSGGRRKGLHVLGMAAVLRHWKNACLCGLLDVHQKVAHGVCC